MKKETIYIHKLFSQFLSEHDFSLDIHNELIRIRNDICHMYDKLVSESKLLKKYKVDVDLLNNDYNKLDLANIDSPYWLKGEIEFPRPPGPTNNEIQILLTNVRNIFTSLSKECPNQLRLHADHTRHLITTEIRKTFSLPNNNIPFTSALYDRNPHSNNVLNQNTPCEICGENRSIDQCHIIPKEHGGPKAPGNILYLCPTHHRLFDRLMLNNNEWNSINWTTKNRISVNYAYHIILPELEKFWESINNKIYEKRTNTFGMNIHSKLPNMNEELILDLVINNPGITNSELLKHSGIPTSQYKKALTSLTTSNKIYSQKIGNKYKYYKM